MAQSHPGNGVQLNSFCAKSSRSHRRGLWGFPEGQAEVPFLGCVAEAFLGKPDHVLGDLKGELWS